MNNLGTGIYEKLLTRSLQSDLDFLANSEKIHHLDTLEDQLLPDYLTRSLQEHILRSLRSVKSREERYEIANRILESVLQDDASAESYSANEENLLTQISETEENLPRPSVPLAFSSLFTGATGSPQLGKELELEFETADRIDLLVSFIKNSGLNLIMGALKRFVKRGGKLRVITTTYMGATNPTAIDRLSKLANTEVKISYDTKASRLHAKAYFIHRKSGLSSAYIGSANLSKAAITAGLEWTLKIPAPELPDLFRRCEAEFESYWESDLFNAYSAGDLDKLKKASEAEKQSSGNSIHLAIFELKPRSYQQDILNKLIAARETRQHFRNLVVAATGTGKTLIAAFDYKNQCAAQNPRPKLLFLVHRKEILHQAIGTFRQVLQDANFGELLVDGETPSNHDYLFCSVSSFHSRKLSQQHHADYWDIVILDEAHHGEAASYRSIFTDLKPKVLLGLTATPERTDGVSIAKDFDQPLAGEIRLPEALEQKLLCPFHYYAVSDLADFTSIKWSRGRYDNNELEDLLTDNDVRVALIISKVIEYLPSPLHEGQFDSDYVKGLGFCVSKKHARYMAEKFNTAGITSASLDSDTSREEREQVRQKLTKGEINFIFVVDLYNEGVDIPDVNTILFLRPTESHVIYLQQFGRGLRYTDDEKHLTVLDFIGEARKEFRFDLRLSSLLPGKRHDLRKEIEHGFPHLPTGCYINFEKKAKERIFKNIQQTYRNLDLRIREAFSQWRGGEAPSFSEFILTTGENPLELLTKRRWSEWKELVGFQVRKNSGTEPELNAQARLTLTNSLHYLSFILQTLKASSDELRDLSEHPLAASLYHLIWNKKGSAFGFDSIEDSFQALQSNQRTRSDLIEITEHSLRNTSTTKAINLPIPCPLELHGTYSRQEIFAAFGKATLSAPSSNREGVMHLNDINTSLHLFTFKKTEKFFSETTSYRDYPISRTLLHWESQSNTSQNSLVGQRYLSQNESKYTVLLFARLETKIGKLASPLIYLGPANLVSAKGNQPIEMIWKLENPMPYDFYIEAKRASGVS